MHQTLPGRRDERRRHLAGDFERQRHREQPLALDAGLHRLALDKFHRVEIGIAASAQMKDRGHIAMPKLGRAARLAQESLRRRRVIHIRGADDLDRHIATQAGIEGLVGHAHRPVTQFHERPVLVFQEFIVLEFLRLRHRAAGMPGGKLTAFHSFRQSPGGQSANCESAPE